MPTLDLKQDYRDENGKLFRAGKGVKISDSLAKMLGTGSTVKGEGSAPPDTGAGRSAMPYADILIPKHFADEDAVDAASDEDLLAIDGIGPKRLAEIREFFGQ
jgi:predicted flap endonuclease-1-like 5' DNA nuclease